MPEPQERFVLVSPALLRLIYASAGVFTLWMTIIATATWRPDFPSPLMLLLLVAAWGYVLLWNPVQEIRVGQGAASLHRRRGPEVLLTRGTLSTMSEYRLGRYPYSTGVRFTLRSGAVIETGSVNVATRLRLMAAIAHELQLCVLDPTEGAQSWIV